jgi:hypothetical protein
MKLRVTQITIVPEGEPIFCDLGYTVKLDDEAAGEFVVIEDHSDDEGSIAINPQDWPALRRAINRMVKNCQS